MGPERFARGSRLAETITQLAIDAWVLKSKGKRWSKFAEVKRRVDDLERLLPPLPGAFARLRERMY